MNINEIKDRGYVSFPYPIALRDMVELSVEAWKAFCELPVEVKKKIPYSNDSDGTGYEIKDGVGKHADRKENFDIAMKELNWLEAHIGDVQHPVVTEFIQRVSHLARLMKPTVLEFAGDVEKAFGIQSLQSEVDVSEPTYFFRFIHYSGERKVGEEIAVAHTDQSGFSFHLFESDPGLQRLGYGGEWEDMPVSSGKTVIFPSMQLQLRSKGRLTALCHRVIATEKTAILGRYSVVCFIQLRDTPKYDKKTHGRIQEKKPGFNYGMSHDEFSTMFK